MTRTAAAPRVGVVVMAKRPEPGAVKTRLAPALGRERAAALYAAMLADRCAQVARLPGVLPALAVAGHPPGAPRPGFVPEGFAVIGQRVPGLGAGLEAAADFCHRRGLPVLLLDSDSPTLPQRYLEHAVERLCAGAQLVLGPSEDGGYYALGLQRSEPALFRDMPWSTDRVAALTLARAQARGLAVERLSSWWDLDTPDRLPQLEVELERGAPAEQTARWLWQHRGSKRPEARPAGGC